MNESIYSEIIFETFPQLAIQIANSQLTGTWTTLGIVSVTISAFNAMHNLYYFLYHVLHKKCTVASLQVGISLRSIDLTLPGATAVNQPKQRSCEATTQEINMMHDRGSTSSVVVEMMSNEDANDDLSSLLTRREHEIALRQFIKRLDRIERGSKDAAKPSSGSAATANATTETFGFEAR